jgi:hypothetical protein
MADFKQFIKGYENPKDFKTYGGYKVDLNEQADILKKSGLASHSYADGEKVYAVSPWTKNPKNNIKSYYNLDGDLFKRFGKGKYGIKYLRDEARDNGKETAGVFEITFK